MSFQIKDRKSQGKFNKVEYMSLTPGTHIVRFLQPTEDANLTVTHFLVTPTTKMTVACLDDECPICQNNRKIYLENPKDFRQVPGYFSKSDRYTLNVFDRTPAKICPSCQTEVKRVGNGYVPTCPNCGTLITSVAEAPVDKVKLLQLSMTAAQQINDIERTQVDRKTGNVFPLTSYDMVFSVSNVNGRKTVTPIPSPANNDVVEVPEEAMLNIDCVMKLTAAEIVDVLKGVALKDIFNARKSNTPVEVGTQTAVEEQSDKDIESKLNARLKELYG